jgi:hypothetical protein
MKKFFLPFLIIIFVSVGLQTRVWSQVVINEYSVSNLNSYTDNYQQYPDWLELYNGADTSVNVKGYFLSDNPGKPTKWKFQDNTVITAHGFKKIWLSGRDEATFSGIHTNFKLTQTKEETESIVLANPSGVITEQHLLEITREGHSRGRKLNGDTAWRVFTVPTFGSSNNAAPAFLKYAEKPVMDKVAGYYPGSFTVTVTCAEPGATIRYTINGTEPTATSPICTGPVSIPATRVLKARAFSTNPLVLPSLTEFNTYFVNVSHSLPVVSVASDQLTDLLNGDASLMPIGSYEYFSPDDVRTTTSYGQIGKHGQDSWANDQRSLDFITRDECGYSYALKGKFFKTSDRAEFQRVILRASGDDNYPGIDSSAHIRDDYVMTLSELIGQNLDWRRSMRCVVYANGQYWGIYSIREKDDDADYTEYYYGQDRYNLQFLLLWGGTWAEYGGQDALDDYHDLHSFITGNDMSNQANYDYVTSQYDPTSLADYMIINSYVVCSDWINWNVGWWRGMDSTGTHKRWGYILWDEDAVLNHYINYTGIPTQLPTATPCFQEDIWQDPEGHIEILNHLLNNPGFRKYYVNRYIDLLNTGFKPAYMINLLDSMAAMIEPELPKHAIRWGGSQQQWLNNIQKIRDFINVRYQSVKAGLNECYNLTGPYPIRVNVDPPFSGKVKMNSIILDSNPWQGSYYGGIDITMKALEVNPGFKFDHWELNFHVVNPSDTATEVSLRLTKGDAIRAVFIPKIKDDTLVINEINYNSSPDFDSGDWAELYNPQPYPVEVTNWVFKDEDDLHAYAFPQGTIIQSYDYLVLCSDTTAFRSRFPGIHNFLGPLGFGFSGNGELLRLFNPDDLLIDTVHYDDVSPWPTAPDGTGPTLELLNPGLDNALAQSWKASPAIHGTPGEPNSISVELPRFSSVSPDAKLLIYPNPMHTAAVVTLRSQQKISNATIIVYNLLGKEVKRFENVRSDGFKISRSGLANGIFIVRLADEGGQFVSSGKLIVE